MSELLLADPLQVAADTCTSTAALASERARSILETAVEGFFQSTLGGRMIGANSALAEILGYDSPRQLTLEIMDVGRQVYVRPEDRERLLQLARKEGVVRGFEFAARKKDGTAVRLRLNAQLVSSGKGEPCCIEGFVTDVTECHRLAEENARLAAIVQSAAHGILAHDLDGTITAWNPALERATGLSAQEAIGMASAHFFPPGETHELEHILAEVRAGRTVRSEARRIGKDGAEFYVAQTVSPIWQDGKITGASVIVEDISARRAMEQSLKLSEERFLLVSRATDDVVWDWDADSDTLWFGDGLTRVLGYGEDERSVDLSWWQRHLHPEDLPQVMNAFHRAIENREERWCGAYRFRLADGEYIHIHDRAYLLHDAEGRLRRMIGSMRDVTENRRLEAELRESEELHRHILSSISDAVFLTDSVGRLVFVCPNVDVIFGWSREVVRALGTIDRLLGDGVLDPALLFRGQEVTNIETTVTNARCEERTLLVNVKHVSIGQATLLFTCRDITERESDRHALQESERRLATLMSNLPGMAYRCAHDENCTMEFGSQGTEALTGYSPDDLVQSRVAALTDLMLPEDRDRVRIEADAALHARTPFSLRYRINTAQGEEKWVWDLGRGIYDREGRLVCLEGFIIDITEQQRTEAALHAAYEKLRQTQQAAMQQERLRALGQMASGIAHDINNSLSPITGFSDLLLLTEPNLSDRARDYLGDIGTAGRDIAHTVSRMREFYRKREGQEPLRLLHLAELARKALDLTRARWHDQPQEHGVVIDVATDFAVSEPDLLGNESELREAIVNLVLNAVDAMPAGGTLTLRSQVACFPVGDKPGELFFEVSDTGVGMTDEVRERCLEPFYSTKGDRGTGLGLSMVFGIMERHHGRIEIDSAPGVGTTMRLVFPLNLAPAGREAGVAEMPKLPARSLRVLCVDDEPPLRKLMRELLSEAGHSVETVAGGGLALELFQQAAANGQPFDLVITDLGMPGVDGRQVARGIKELAPATPVIMLTGWGDHLHNPQSTPQGVDRVVDKPPTCAQLLGAIAAVLPT